MGGVWPPSAERMALWRAMVQARILWALPRTWADRAAGWAVGAVFRVDRVLRLPEEAQTSLSPEGVPTVLPDAIACLVPDRTGRLWAYTHRAVGSAVRACRHFRIGDAMAAPARIGWLNGLPKVTGHTAWRAPSPWPGWDAWETDRRLLLFHPRLLGPVGAVLADGSFEPSPDLCVKGPPHRVRVRGPIVPNGLWQNNRVEPMDAAEGWFWLP